MPSQVQFSIVIPVKDEEGSVARVAAEVAEVMASVPFVWEVVWVDDGSSDATAERVLALSGPHRLIRLDRNHGQSAAFAAGIRAARGAWIGTMDGDGQNDPRDLLRQLDHARLHDLDMVNGVRVERRDGLLRRISGRIANAVRNRVTRDRVTDVGCSTRVARRAVLLEAPFFHGMHRFLPTLVRMRGYRVDEIPVNHRSRLAGCSKYGVRNRLWRGIRDLVGVRWLVDRQVRWTATEVTPGAGETAGGEDGAREDAGWPLQGNPG
jgi:dolichol-phosphate mannosyltransferase